MRHVSSRGLLLTILLQLLGCAAVDFETQAYRVNSGDTLYFIAWKYKIDYLDLARWNGLSPPYNVYPGQRLLIRPSLNLKTTSRYYTVRKGDTLYDIGRKSGVSVAELVRANQLSSPDVIYPGQTLLLRQTSNVRPTVQAPRNSRLLVAKPKFKTDVTAKKLAPEKWVWPVRGKVLQFFQGPKSVQQGIDVSGEVGQLIGASAEGQVVYSGSGLVSYGKLVIVKHNDFFLSAYGYNSTLLVEEGDTVKAGQPIAKMGKSGHSAKLHFEIRKHGKPVNPLDYLPKGG